MLKKFFILSSIIAIALCSCNEEKGNPPSIRLDSEGITGIYAGDVVSVTGKVTATDHKLSGIYWIHQKLIEAGIIDEQPGGQIKFEDDGTFSLSLTTVENTVGVRIIAVDDKNNKSEAVFSIILNEDALVLSFDGAGFIQSIFEGEDFTVQGTVTSGSPITNLNYSIVRGEVSGTPVIIPVTNVHSAEFNIPLIVQAGMTGVRFNATNRNSMTAEKMFELRHVQASSLSVAFDLDNITVYPDFEFVVSGQLFSEHSPISALSYIVTKTSGDEPEKTAVWDSDNKFSISLTANDAITSVKIKATNAASDEKTGTIPVTVLYPTRIEGEYMVHYKNIVLVDNGKNYFSLDVAPYVLNTDLARENIRKVNLIFGQLNGGNANSAGAAVIGASTFSHSGTNSLHLVPDSWGVTQADLLTTRIPPAASFGDTPFDQLGDSQESWGNVYSLLLNHASSNNSIFRLVCVGTTAVRAVGDVFPVLTSATGAVHAGENGGSTHCHIRGIGTIRAKGGTASPNNTPTGAWVELEIKIIKSTLTPPL